MSLTQGPVAILLKNETLAEHQYSESILMPVLSNLSSQSSYGTVLKTFYGFYHPLQQLIANYISPAQLPDINERVSAAKISEDLRSLNLSSASIALCPYLPTIRSGEEAFGALYVLEGSTLGGRYIRNMLLQKPELQLTEASLHFFSGYGSQTGEKWTGFLSALNQQQDQDSVVATAKSTFTLFSNWLKQTLTS